MVAKNLPKAGFTLAKIALGGVVLIGLGAATLAYAQTKPLQTVDKVQLDRYLGEDLVVSKCDVLTTYLSCLDCILIKIDARQLHDFLSSWKSLKFSV